MSDAETDYSFTSEDEMASNGDEIHESESYIIDIEKRILDNLSEIRSSKDRNYRVIGYLKSKKPMCFQPEITVVGWDFDERFRDTIVEHKKSCLKRLLERKGQEETVSVKKLLEELHDMTTKDEELHRMIVISEGYGYGGLETMLYDGVFMVELLRRCKKISSSRLPEQDTSLSLSQATQDRLVGDLLLLGNQFPFCVLQKLFHMTLMEGEEPNHFIPLAIHFLSKNVMHGFPGNLDHHIRRSQNDDIKHLLGLLYKSLRPSLIHPKGKNNNDVTLFISEHMLCATKLEELGITIKKQKDKNLRVSFFDITFKDGVLSIPKLTLYGHWDKVFINLLAYEHCIFGALDSRYVTDYVRFMAILINTEKDVEFLRSCGVIDCRHGNDEAVATMFSELANNVIFSPGAFLYSDIFIQMQSHYNSRESYWNRKWTSWKAAFWHDYFSTPWGAVSVIAAAILLILTVLQTTFTILPYYHPH